MVKPAGKPQPVQDDGSPILPPPSTGAQAPTVVADKAGDPTDLPEGALDQALADAIASGSAPSGFAVNDDGSAGEPLTVHANVVPVDASGNPSAQPQNELQDADARPEFVAYCLNPECPVDAVQLWEQVSDAHQVMCHCGQLLHDAPQDPPA